MRDKNINLTKIVNKVILENESKLNLEGMKEQDF